MKIASQLIAFAALSLTVACSAAGGEEPGSDSADADIGTSEQAIGESTCATTTNFDNTAFISSTSTVQKFTSGSTYGIPSCTHAYRVKVVNLSSGAGAVAAWADTVPTTQADCQNSFVRVVAYQGTTKISDREARGTWSGTKCFTGLPSTDRIDLGQSNHVQVRARLGSVDKKVRVTIQGTP